MRSFDSLLIKTESIFDNHRGFEKIEREGLDKCGPCPPPACLLIAVLTQMSLTWRFTSTIDITGIRWWTGLSSCEDGLLTVSDHSLLQPKLSWLESEGEIRTTPQ